MNLHIVFNIDTLVMSVPDDDNGFERAILKWGHDNNLIVPINEKKVTKNGVLYPGTLELMHYLFSQSTFKVSFFSNVDEKKIKSFVEVLLIRALGQTIYEQIKKEVGIYSSQHLVENPTSKANIQYRQFGLNQGYLKKDLLTIVKQEELNRTVLIESDITYIQYQQECNFIKVSNDSPFAFTNLKNGDDSFFNINHIFYIMGVLKNALEHPQFADYLFDSQFIKEETGNYTPVFYQLRGQQDYYDRGLEELRKINSSITLLDDIHMQPYMSLYVGQQEEKELNAKRKKMIERDNSCQKYINNRILYWREFKPNESDFYQLCAANKPIKDTTLLLAKIMNDFTCVKVFIGPACGKSLHLSMLYYFLDEAQAKEKVAYFKSIKLFHTLVIKNTMVTIRSFIWILAM